MRAVLLDTSVLIAGELGPSAERAAISVVTVFELHVGVLMARDESARARRLGTLALVERSHELIPVDDQIAARAAALVAAARQSGRKPRVADSLIAATAAVHRMTLRTRDRGFRTFAGDLDVEIIGG